MNFLAHLHLAEYCGSDLTGNLLADFIRGDPYRQYSSNVADGIKLHRFVDSYIDAMPEALLCRQHFTPETRRVSGIALDITWDHFLAKHWQHYHSVPLAHFVEQAQKEIALFNETQPEHFTLTMQRMWQQQWLIRYQQPEAITQALERMALRRPRLYQLANCPAVILQHYTLFEHQFHLIYPQVQHAAKTFSLKQ